MANSISPIHSIPNLQTPRVAEPAGKPGAFQSVLEGTLRTLGSVNQEASGAIDGFLTGENEELHTTALAVQKAELAFDLSLQVRNKVIAAYQEIMRMQM